MRRTCALRSVIGIGTLALLFGTAGAAQIPFHQGFFRSFHDTDGFGSSCTSGTAGGSTSYVSSDPDRDDVFISGLATTAIFCAVGANVLCYGAEREETDRWYWWAGYRLDAVPGTVADVTVELMMQWYRYLWVGAPNFSEAELEAAIVFSLRRRDGSEDRVGSIWVDESSHYSELGFTEHEDWRTREVNIRGMTTDDMLLISGTATVHSHTDLKDYFPGYMQAQSTGHFTLVASAWEAAPPMPVTEPGRLTLLGLGLAGATGIAWRMRRRT